MPALVTVSILLDKITAPLSSFSTELCDIFMFSKIAIQLDKLTR